VTQRTENVRRVTENVRRVTSEVRQFTQTVRGALEAVPGQPKVNSWRFPLAGRSKGDERLIPVAVGVIHLSERRFRKPVDPACRELSPHCQPSEP
jgi:hypothetical protein